MLRRAPRLAIAFAIAAGLAAATAPPAAAEAPATPTAEDRETARTLLLDGRAKYDAKDYKGALRSFQAAHAIMGVPTTGYDLARAQEALGMLVEARATALDVGRIPQSRSEPSAFTDARVSAAEFAERLVARIPALLITVSGPPEGADIRVTVDGRAIPSASLSLPRKLNPGAHTVEASSDGFRPERRAVEVKEGESQTVAITLTPPVSQKPKEEEPTLGQRLESAPSWALAAGTVGVIALGVSVGFGIDYANTRSQVAADCPNYTCVKYTVAQAEEARARWNRDAGLWIGLGAAGLAGIGAGLFGILTAEPRVRGPHEEAKARGAFVTAAPWLPAGGAGASIAGAF